LTVRLCPPLVIGKEEIDLMVSIIDESLTGRRAGVRLRLTGVVPGRCGRRMQCVHREGNKSPMEETLSANWTAARDEVAA
jgi:hypothetical protein